MWLSAVNAPDCPDNVVHKMLWGYFPGLPNGEPRPYLYRNVGERIVMLSRIQPECQTTNIAERVRAGSVYQCDVLASPRNGHKSKVVKAGGKRGHRFIRDNAERKAWFARRLQGAEPTFVHIYDRNDVHIGRRNGHRITRPACRIQGTVRVTDRAAFVDTLLRGIGGGGAWGFGLMVLPEVMTWSH